MKSGKILFSVCLFPLCCLPFADQAMAVENQPADTSSESQVSESSSDATSRTATSEESVAVTAPSDEGESQPKAETENIIRTAMYRLYNPNSGEHFYTADLSERNTLILAGWKYESVGWYAPSAGEAVYRVYNPNAGDHHYTLDQGERDGLLTAGWKDEGVSWYSSENKEVPLYRAYNPNADAGSHNYTVSSEEQSELISADWKDEGIAWYGLENPNKAAIQLEKAKSDAISGFTQLNLRDALIQYIAQADKAVSVSEISEIIAKAKAEASANDADDLASASIRIENADQDKGRMDIIISDIHANSGISKVEVPVWSAPDQKDIKWYIADKQPDGTYKVSFDIANHQFNIGTYSIHAYITQGNGRRNLAGYTTAEVTAKSVLGAEGIGNGKIRIIYYHPEQDLSDVRFAVWSDLNGQNDLKWYPAGKSQNGWTAEVNTADHDALFGSYIIHAYSGDTYLDQTTVALNDGYKLIVPVFGQLPELPTGCEATAVAMMLSFKGSSLSKTDAANLMPRHAFDPNLGFVGDPYKKTGNTIYPPAFEKLLKAYGGGYTNLTGASLETLQQTIRSGKPAVVWMSGMHGFGVHALTVTGYDNSAIYYNDPWTGKRASMAVNSFIQLWNSQQRRGVSY